MPAGRGGRGRMPSQHPHAVWPMPGAVTIRPALAPSAPGRPESSDQARCVPSGPAKSGRPVKGPASIVRPSRAGGHPGPARIVRPSLAMRSGAGDNLPTKSGDVRSGRPARIVRPKLAARSRRTSRQVPALIAPARQVVQSGVAALNQTFTDGGLDVGANGPCDRGNPCTRRRRQRGFLRVAWTIEGRTGCRSKVDEGLEDCGRGRGSPDLGHHLATGSGAPKAPAPSCCSVRSLRR
jgi:hypothetical protein